MSSPSGRWLPNRSSDYLDASSFSGGNAPAFPPLNDHGLLTWEPAIGRQIQGAPLALRRALQRASSAIRRTSASPNLERSQVLGLLPFGDLDAVLVPLLPLQLDVAREDVLAERATHEIRARELVDRLPE